MMVIVHNGLHQLKQVLKAQLVLKVLRVEVLVIKVKQDHKVT